MRKSQLYPRTRFPASVLRQAIDVLRDHVGEGHRVDFAALRTTQRDRVRWSVETFDEWLALYQDQPITAQLECRVLGDVMKGRSSQLEFTFYASGDTEVEVEARDRSLIERAHQAFRDAAADARLPEPERAPTPAPRIFIGHGRAPDWRDLKDHLADVHGYDVQAFESGPRAGHTVRDVIDSLRTTSDFALLVMTGEDETAEGGLRARQNVVHEIGLFQGHLGWNRAIVLAENGVEPFSNLAGIVEIRFSKGNVRETFGDVLGVLRREFGPPPA